MDEIDLEDFCQTIQQDISDLAEDNYPLMKREPTGLLDAVVSPQNRSGFSQEYGFDGGNGKLKQVLIEWNQPIPYTEMVTSRQDVCTTGDMIEPIRELRTLTGFLSTKPIYFDKTSMRKLCDGPSEYRAKIINSHMGGFFRALNRLLVTKYLAGVGDFIDAAAGKEVFLLDDTGPIRQVDPNGEVEITNDMDDLGISRPIMVGNGVLRDYAKLANIGCCNAFGQDNGALASDWDWFKDRDVPSVSGNPNTILAFAPGAVQLATYSENRGEFGIVHEHFAESNIVDPVTGITLDYEMRYDQCEKAWAFIYYLHYDLMMLPDALFMDTDERDGVNYAFRYIGRTQLVES